MATENENWQEKPEEGASQAGREGSNQESVNREDSNERPRFPRRENAEGGNSYDRPHFQRRSYGEGGYSNDRPRRSYGERGGNSYDRPRFPRRDNAEGGNSYDRPRFPRRDNAEGGNSYDRPRFPRRDNAEGENSYDRPRRSYGDQNSDRPRFPRRDNAEGGNSYDRPRFPRRDNAEGGNSYDRPRFPRRDNAEGGNSYDRPRFPRRDNNGEGGNTYDRPRFPRRDNNGEGGNFERRPRPDFGEPTLRADGRIRRPRIKKESGADWLTENEFKVPKYAPNLDPTTPIRLNRYLSNAGICSRREADEYIQAGVVKVNGEVASELGVKVLPTDEIMFHDQPVKIERKVYVLLNKPKDCVTTSEDPQERLTVMDLVKGACAERIYPVGRLDRNTTGVLLLTNDGDLASKLAHPKYEKRKIYQATLDKDLTEEDMTKISEGVVLDGEKISVDEISLVNPEKRYVVGIEIHSGQNRVVRRIFEQFGYKVFKLDRVYFAGLTKKNLPRGKWRHLTPREVGLLKMGAFV